MGLAVVTGATGLLGSNLALELLAQGHRVRALEKGRVGERYIFAGHTLRYGALGALIAEVGGVPRVTRTMPRWLATLGGRFGDVLEAVSAGEPLVNRCTVNWAYAEGFHFSSEKARAELGYSFGPVEVALRDAIAWLRQRGVLPKV